MRINRTALWWYLALGVPLSLLFLRLDWTRLSTEPWQALIDLGLGWYAARLCRMTWRDGEPS